MKPFSLLQLAIPPRWLALAVAISALSMEGSAAIIADFQYGGSTSSPVTNQVDAWSGMAGDGWLTPWTHNSNTEVTITAGVESGQPLTTGHNRLRVTSQNPDTATRASAVNRKYDAASFEGTQVISFQFRLDSDPATTLNRIRIFDGAVAALAETSPGANVTWFLRANPGGNWLFYNGTSSVNTGIALTQGNVYEFTIAVTENTYTAEVRNLTTSGSYTSGNLAFYSAQEAVGGYLNFSVNTMAGATTEFSISSISVIPEPGTTTAMALGGLLLGGHLLLRQNAKTAAR